MYNNLQPHMQNQSDQLAVFRKLFASNYGITEDSFDNFCFGMPNELALRILSLIATQSTPNKSMNMMKIFHFSDLWQKEVILNAFLVSISNNWLENTAISRDVDGCFFDILYQRSVMKEILTEEPERYLTYQRNTATRISELLSKLSELESEESMIRYLKQESRNIQNEMFHPDHLQSQNEFLKYLKYLQDISVVVQNIRWLNNREAVAFVYTHFQNSFADFDRHEKNNIDILNDTNILTNKEQIMLALKYKFTPLNVLGFPLLSHPDQNVRSKAMYYIEKITSEFHEPVCNTFMNSFLFITNTESMEIEYQKIKTNNSQFLKEEFTITGTEESYKIKGLDQIEDVLDYITNSTDSSQIRKLSTSTLKYINHAEKHLLITNQKALDIKEKILDIAMQSISRLENKNHNEHSNYRSL